MGTLWGAAILICPCLEWQTKISKTRQIEHIPASKSCSKSLPVYIRVKANHWKIREVHAESTRKSDVQVSKYGRVLDVAKAGQSKNG